MIKENKVLFSNILSLGSLQIFSYILPLITVPYIVRVLGPEYYGMIAFCSAVTGYWLLITDYGFSLTATKEVSLCRDNKRDLRKLYSTVLCAKMILCLFCFILLVIMIQVFTKININKDIYFILFGQVIGQVLFPVWLFQGLEKMKYITILNIISRAFIT
ncbi:oligosaccharide flippase family protein, partial [Vibrio sp. CAIM 722]